MEPQIRLHNTSLPSPLPGSPSFIFHLTLLQNTLFIWVGTGQPTDPSTSPDEMITPAERNIAQDWAVSMPSRPVSRTRFEHLRAGRVSELMDRTCPSLLPRYIVVPVIWHYPCLNASARNSPNPRSIYRSLSLLLWSIHRDHQ